MLLSFITDDLATFIVMPSSFKNRVTILISFYRSSLELATRDRSSAKKSPGIVIDVARLCL